MEAAKILVDDMATDLQLMQHQVAAVDKCNGSAHFGYLMGVGTGKTYTVLEDAYRLYQNGKINVLLVIAPKIICKQWQKEIERYYLSKGTNFSIAYKKAIFSISSSRLNVFITNVESFSGANNKVRRMHAMLIDEEHENMMVVLDESTKIKAISSKRTVALIKTCKQVAYKRILTGSPITENLIDGYTQFRFLSDTIFPMTYSTYKDMFVVTIKKRTPYGEFVSVVGSKNVRLFVDTIKPFVFQCDIKDCVDMPSKVYREIGLELSEEIQGKYNKLRDHMVYELLETNKDGNKEILVPFALAQLHKLQEIISRDSCKYEAITEILEEHGNAKVIVWCTHLIEVALCKAHIAQAFPHRKVAIITGEEKNDITNADIIITTTQSASHGLNLQEFTVNIFYSRLYSMEMKLQSEARTYRIGSSSTVFYYDLIVEDTIDRDIVNTLNKKYILVSDLVKLLKGVH